MERTGRGPSRSFTGEWLDAIYANGRFVLGGGSGRIAVSTNGTDWLAQTVPSLGSVSRITFANGLYVAVDEPYGLLISPDATNWTLRTPSTTTWPTDIAGGAGWWVARDRFHRLLISSDLATWSTSILRTSSALNSLAFGDHTFVVVGDSGIWQSDPLLVLEIGRQVPHTITVSGPRERECELQRCADLASGSWEPVASLTLSNGPVSWIEPQPSANATYRALLTR